MIPTVLGPIEPSAVTGKCSPHEHLLAKPPGMTPAMLAKIHEDPITLSNLGAIRSQPEGSCASDCLLSLDEIVQELGDLVSAGGNSALVLDCTSADQGRHPEGLVDVAKRTGMHVVMAASWRRVSGSVLRQLGSYLEITKGLYLATELAVRLLNYASCFTQRYPMAGGNASFSFQSSSVLRVFVVFQPCLDTC